MFHKHGGYIYRKPQMEELQKTFPQPHEMDMTGDVNLDTLNMNRWSCTIKHTFIVTDMSHLVAWMRTQTPENMLIFQIRNWISEIWITKYDDMRFHDPEEKDFWEELLQLPWSADVYTGEDSMTFIFDITPLESFDTAEKRGNAYRRTVSLIDETFETLAEAWQCDIAIGTSIEQALADSENFERTYSTEYSIQLRWPDFPQAE